MRRVLFRILPAVFLALAANAHATNYSGWHWYRPFDPVWLNEAPTDGKYLTTNNGAHSVAMHNYNDGAHKHRLLVAANLVEQASYNNRVYEFLDIWDAQGQEVTPWYDDENSRPMSACITAGPNSKHVAWVQSQSPYRACCASQTLQTRSSDWDYFGYLNDPDDYASMEDIAIATQTWGYDWVYVAHRDDDGTDKLYCSRSSNGGENWEASGTIRSGHEPVHPSLGVGGPGVVYCAFQHDDDEMDDCDIYFRSSTNYGATWSVNETDLTPDWANDELPCLAASGSMVFVCWTDYDGNIVYRWSSDGGSSWTPDPTSNPPADPAIAWPKVTYPTVIVADQVNAVLIPGGTWGSKPYWHLLLAAKGCVGTGPELTYTALKRGALTTDGVVTWDPVLGMSPWCLVGDFPGYCPSVCGEADGYDTLAACVWSDPGRNIYVAKGRWANWHDYQDPPGQADNVGRRLFLDPDGSLLYAAGRSPYAVWGPVLGGYTVPMLADCGFRPALAVDGDGAGWLAYTRDDTVWCILGEDGYKAVFAGSGSAIPGQPSIVCYPGQAGGVYVGNVVFAVYDTAGGASRIMYARVDTGAVVLDTIESVANLKDSLPCINVYKTDSLLVTWQHGDSTLGSMLCDYGPGTAGQVPAWTSPSLVSANSYHAMSAFDEGGSVLNCIWTRNNGSNYAIQRATCDLASAAFGSWTPMATPGDTGSAEKANPVFAGLGVSCWQEKAATGEWIIKGYVRGEEETFVANDTDAYHPHAVAESSAVSPSIDQIRVHLLYTAGVTFEVDSGVFDTGDVRFVTCSLNVSHAGSDATKYNNGTKLLRKADSDSLLAVYADLDNAVMWGC